MSSVRDGVSTGFAGDLRLSLADETRALADQVQQLALAAAAAAAATAAVSCASGSPRAAGSSSTPEVSRGQDSEVATLLGCAEVSDWEVAATLLTQEEAIVEELRQEEAAAAAVAAAELERAAAREAAEAGAEVRAAASREVAGRWRSEEAAEAEAAEATTTALRRGIAEAEARAQRARDEAADEAVACPLILPSRGPRKSCGGKGEALEAAVAEASKAQEEAAAAEASVDALEEERTRLRDELDSLRFQVKDMKKTQHKRAQDLDAQVRKLEKQRRNLESEKEARLRSEEAAEAANGQNLEKTRSQLAKLQQLNELLQSQVQDALQERSTHDEAVESLRGDVRQLRRVGEEEEREIKASHERLDELCEADGELRREAKKLQNRAILLSRQVATLKDSASNKQLQLDEAEAALDRAREEEHDAARRSEILDWKLQVAATHLNRGSGQGAGASAGTGSGRTGKVHRT